MKTRTELHRTIGELKKRNLKLDSENDDLREESASLERYIDLFKYSDEQAELWQKDAVIFKELFSEANENKLNPRSNLKDRMDIIDALKTLSESR